MARTGDGIRELEFDSLASFPTTGEEDKLYIATDENDIYRWNGSAYVKVSEGDSTEDNTTEPNIPYKISGTFENSNLSQDPDGKIRASTQIIAEGGIDTTPATVILGDALSIEGSSGQQINRSSVTGVRYQIPYQEIDKTGSNEAFQINADAEVVDDIRQPVFDTTLTSPIVFTYIAPRNEIVNKVYLRSDGDVTNFRYQVKSNATNEIVDSYPNKFAYEKDEGITLTGAGVQEIDLYYSEESAPNRFIDGDTYEITIKYDTGNLLGNVSDDPYYAYDYQNYQFVDIISELDYAKESISTSLIYGGEITRNDNTSVNITPGAIRVFSVIDPGTGEVTSDIVKFDGGNNITIPNIGTNTSTRIAVNITGGILTIPFTLTPLNIRQYGILGYVIHPYGIIESDEFIFNDSLKAQNLYNQIIDGIETLGVTRKTGLNISGNADLTIAKTAGELQSAGAGTGSGNEGQNRIEIDAENPALFTTILGKTDTAVSFDETNIDPEYYDDGTGTKALIPQPGNSATIKYVYQGAGGNLFLMYGQTVYPTLDDAILNAPNDEVFKTSEINERANLIARIAVTKECLDLTDGTKAQVLAGVKFGAGLSGGSFGAGTGGGDVLGPATSSVDEIATYVDTTGKVIKASSDINAINGILSRNLVNGDLEIERNGNGRIIIGNSEFLPTPNTNNKIIFHREGGANGVEISTGSANSVWTQYTINNNRAGATGVNNGRNGIGLYHGPDVNSATYAELNTDGFVISDKHLSVNTTEYPRGVIQANKQPNDVGSFDDDIDCPLVGNIIIDNGGSVPASPEPALVLQRPGVSAEAFTNILTILLSRYENSVTNSRTQADFRLSHGSLATEGNDGPIIMSLKSNGDVRLGDFLFLDNGEIKLLVGEEMRLDDYLVTGGFETLDIDARTHIVGEIFHNTDTERLQQFVGPIGEVKNVGDVISTATTGIVNKLAIMETDGTVKDGNVSVTNPSGSVVIIEPDPGTELRIIPESDAFPIIIGSTRIYPSKISIGGPAPSDDAIASFIDPFGAVLLTSGTVSQRDLITNPKDFMVRGNTDSGHVEYYNNGQWRPFGESSPSLHIVMGAEVGFTATGPVDFPDIPTNVAVRYYNVNGTSGNLGDYNGITYTLPANAPTGLYDIVVSCHSDLTQGIDALASIDALSQADIYVKLNGLRAGFQPGADLRLPWAICSPYQYSMHSKGTRWMEPGDEIQPRIDFIMSNLMTGFDWSLTQMKFEITYIGVE